MAISNRSEMSKKIAAKLKKLVAANQKISCTEICKEYKCAYQTVYNIGLRNGIKIPEYNQKLKTATEESSQLNIETSTSNNEEIKPNNSKKYNFKINEKYAAAFSIEKRQDFWTDKNKEIKVIDVPDKKEIKVIDVPEKKEIKIVSAKTSEMICGEQVYDFNSNFKPFVFAGLIAKRHDNIDNSTKLFVFDEVDDEEIHNYKRFDELADKFVKENVLNKGYTKLKVAITGLTPAAAAIIKAAYGNNISLSLMHYDRVLDKYREQIIIGDDDNYDTDNLSLLQVFAMNTAKKNFKIKLVSFPEQDYNELKTLYVVKVENTTNKQEQPIIYITFDMTTMFNIYREMVEKVMTVKFVSYKISANEIGFGHTNKEFAWINDFGYYYNTPKPIN